MYELLCEGCAWKARRRGILHSSCRMDPLSSARGGAQPVRATRSKPFETWHAPSSTKAGGHQPLQQTDKSDSNPGFSGDGHRTYLAGGILLASPAIIISMSLGRRALLGIFRCGLGKQSRSRHCLVAARQTWWHLARSAHSLIAHFASRTRSSISPTTRAPYSIPVTRWRVLSAWRSLKLFLRVRSSARHARRGTPLTTSVHCHII